jgi:hypothetical protein
MSRRRRRRHDLRHRVAEDAVRTQGLMVATITDARRVGFEVPEGITASTVVWRYWAAQLQVLAEEGE